MFFFRKGRPFAPAILSLQQGATINAPELFPVGAEFHRYIAAGDAELRLYSPQDGPLSELLSSYTRYVASGEINSTVDDQAARLAALEAAYGGRDGVTIDELDGLTVDGGRWWFNVRASNTEPLLRLNVEADDEATMAAVRDEVLGIIRAKSGQ